MPFIVPLRCANETKLNKRGKGVACYPYGRILSYIVMRQEQSYIGHKNEIVGTHSKRKIVSNEDFVLEKNIFNNIFEKDIRRVFIYKKAERLAKAIHLIAPAFTESMALRNRIDATAIGLIDAAILPLGASRTVLPRELLALSSMLSIARVGGLLSSMNAELITREIHILIQEVVAYEEPRISLDESSTLSNIAKKTISRRILQDSHTMIPHYRAETVEDDKGHIKDIKNVSDGHIKDRTEAVLSVIKNKKRASIKDISALIRGVSEKTIQRELTGLIRAGIVLKQGERRWSTYSLT